MKTLINLCVMAVLGIAFASFSLADNTLTLEQALAEKKVRVNVLPYGETGHEGIRIDVINTTGNSLNLKMPKGTLFVPDNPGEQTLITSGDELFALSPRQEKVVERHGFCTELHDHGSEDESTFQLSFTQNANLMNIINYMDSLKINNQDMIQHAVWCITDNHPVSYVYSSDTSATRLVQTRLCALTSQAMPWYATESDIVITPQREYVVEAKTVSGELSFTSATRTNLQGLVKDSTGKVVTTNPRLMTCPPGKVTFQYKLTVRGWAKGKYSVVYLNNGVEMINQPFEI